MYFPHPTTTDLLQKSAIAPVLANATGTLVATIPSEQVDDWRNGVDEWKSTLKTAQETRRTAGSYTSRGHE